MIKHYGIIGTNAYGIDLDEDATIWSGWILMKEERPTDEYYADENGEWLTGPSPQVLQQMRIEARENQTNILSLASDMIGALSDEIEGLEDSNDVVPDKLRADLKSWKQYRVKVKNIDVSLVPDIEWPIAPE